MAADSINYKFSGISKSGGENEFYSLRYAEFVVPLVKAVQEQQGIIDNQQTQIDTLTTQLATQQALLNDLILRVRALEE
ncbi:MAG: hypothetical protein H7X99_05340 [Saprospiraceae bacterium]|nr:hypothetical protein [Saprospiraceae bacterium]